jgi:uncharacterized protein
MQMKKLILICFLLLLIPGIHAKSGSMKLLAVSADTEGSMADLYLEIKDGSGRVFIDSFPLSRLDTQISTRFAKEVACNFLERDCSYYDFFYTIRANSAIIGGPSAGAAIAILTVAVLDDLPLDRAATITGTINTGGIIGPVGGILPKVGAAPQAGITKVIIPKYTKTNESNITEYESIYNVDVIEVSQLTEAVRIMTGRDYSTKGDVSISEEYIETMRGISVGLCERAEEISGRLVSIPNISADLLRKGKAAIESGEYYSAASFCFGSGFNSRHRELQEMGLSDEMLSKRIDETLERVEEFHEHTKKRELKTITDLEAFMVVTDRLLESKERLTDARAALLRNDTNSSLYNLAYGMERLNSGHSWSVFFGKGGSAYNINRRVLDDSCLKKISEVEERVQYIEQYLPVSTNEIGQTIKKAYIDYNTGNPELCLYKASIAKARVNSVLNTMSIDEKHLADVLDDRQSLVYSVIAKQSQRGMFPILGYSYYQYASSLKESDEYSSMLYYEYALELGNLDIYFEKKKIALPRINKEYTLIFAGGIFSGIWFGMAAGFVIRDLYKRKNKRSR